MISAVGIKSQRILWVLCVVLDHGYGKILKFDMFETTTSVSQYMPD